MLQPTFKSTTLSGILAATMGIGLAGCIEDSAEDTTLIEGVAIVSGSISGDIEVVDSNNNSVASGKVEAGSFSLKVSNSALTEELTFKVTGIYKDSASDESITLDNENALTLTTPESTYQKGQTGNAPITPGSSVISYLVKDHGKTIEQAKASFKTAFGYEPNMDAKPFSPSILDSASAAERPQADRDAAFRAGAFSQLASELSLSSNDIAGLLNAIAEDLSDDDLDGSDGANGVMLGTHNLQTLHNTLPLDTRVLAAYSGFAGSSSNTSGIPAPASNLPKIKYDAAGAASKTITTDSGRVITVSLDTEANPPIPQGFWVSHVNHKITLQDESGVAINTSSDEEIIGVMQHPNMRMITGHVHSTPHSMMTDTSESADGIYNMDSYYVMPSQMGMGENAVPMGLWSYTVKVKEDTNNDGEADKTHAVVFHPQVKMPMPMDSEAPVDVLFSLINNSNYQWTTMMGATETRPFRVWLHEITPNTDSSHALTVFISTRDMKNPEEEGDSSNGHQHMHHKPQSRAMEMDHGSHDLMSFPAVYAGQILHGPLSDGTRPEHTLSSVTVDVSTDGGTTWETMQADGDNTGRFSIDSLSGISTSEQNTLSFRLMINDGTSEYEMKTNGGNYGTLKFTAPTL